MTADRTADRIVVGYVARPHGVRGELRVQTHNPESTTLFDVERVWLGGVERAVKQVRPVPGALLVTLTGIDDRNASEAVVGQSVEVMRGDVSLDEGEVLVADLPGCVVLDRAGRSYGVVASVLHGAQDMLVVHGDDGELLVPMVPELVVEIDVAARRVVVELPEGLPVEPLRRR